MRIAAGTGIAPSEYVDGQPGWFELIEQEAPDAFSARPDMGATTWMTFSGLTHPSFTRAMLFSVYEEFEPAVDGVHTTRISGSTTAVGTAAIGAFIFARGADALIRRRRLQVDRTGA